MTDDILERAKAALEGVGGGPWCWDWAMRELVPGLIAEVERLRPFSRCPGCGRSDTTIATLHEESPDIACSFCGYGT